MAIAFASVGTIARTGAGTSVSPGAPSGVATGDLLVINACAGGTNTINTPTGWTLIVSQNHQFSAARSAMFYRIADGTADDTPSVTCTSSDVLAAVICRITGASATPLDTFWSGQESDPIDIPSGTIAENGSLIVAMVGAAASSSGPSITAGTYTIRSGHTTSPTLATLSDAVDAGSDGAGTLDYSSATIRYAYIAAAFKPAAGAGFTVTDVDLDETVTDGQTGVVVTITGTVSATGKKVFITQGANSVEQTVTAQDASSATITVSYGGVLTAGAATLSVRNPL